MTIFLSNILKQNLWLLESGASSSVIVLLFKVSSLSYLEIAEASS